MTCFVLILAKKLNRIWSPISGSESGRAQYLNWIGFKEHWIQTNVAVFQKDGITLFINGEPGIIRFFCVCTVASSFQWALMVGRGSKR
jgi:hypothetical protein